MFSFSSEATNRITLQQRTLSDDGYGSEQAIWSHVDTVWAVLNVQAGSSGLSGDIIPQSTQNMVAWIRFREGLDVFSPEKYRVQVDGRIAVVTGIARFDAERQTLGRAYLRLNLTFDAPTRG